MTTSPREGDSLGKAETSGLSPELPGLFEDVRQKGRGQQSGETGAPGGKALEWTLWQVCRGKEGVKPEEGSLAG